MKKLYLLKTILLLCALVAGSGSVWAVEETVTYTFTSKSWAATCNNEDANWTSGKDGAGFSNNGVQVTTNSTGANATSPISYSDISKIVVTYNTNASKGAGTLGIKIGNNEETVKNWAYSTGTGSSAYYTLQYDYATPQSGNVKITANTTTNSIYVVSIAITYTADSRANADLAYDPEEVTLELEEEFESPEFSNPHNLTVAYSSSNSEVATVHPTTGVISFVGGLGTAVITATSAANDDYIAGEATFTINVVRKTPTLTVSGNIDMKTGELKTINSAIYTTNSDGSVTVSSSNTSVVSISEGKLNALATGSAVITVSVAQGNTYAAIEKTFTITVDENPAVAPAGQGVGSGYTLVTDASSLRAGDKIIIVGGSYAMSTEQKSNNRGETSVSITNNAIANISNTVQVITLEGSTDSWYLNVGNGYLYAASSSNNYLRTEIEKDNNNNAKAKITISDGKATIQFQGTYTRNYIRYNSSSSLFSCYGSKTSESDIYIYRENVAESFDVEIGAACWRTIVTALDVTLPSGLKAYTAKISGDKAVLTEVDELAAGVPYLLEGDADTYTLTVTTGVSTPDDNDLAISTATTGNGVFVLAKKDNVVGFYKWNGGYIGAGRVYLPAPAEAREFIGFGFEDEAASVEEKVTVNNEKCATTIYDLQGRKVNTNAKKGLYIVNGKKVVY